MAESRRVKGKPKTACAMVTQCDALGEKKAKSRAPHVNPTCGHSICFRVYRPGHPPPQARTPEEIRAWLVSLAQFSDKVPPLPGNIKRD